RGSKIQMRQRGQTRAAPGQCPPEIQVESPAVSAFGRDFDDLRTDAPRDVAERRVNRDVHDDLVPRIDEACVDQEVPYRGPGRHEDSVRTRAVSPRDQPPKLRRPVSNGPLQVQVFGQASPESVEAELADVREGDVQPGTVDSFVVQPMLEG